MAGRREQPGCAGPARGAPLRRRPRPRWALLPALPLLLASRAPRCGRGGLGGPGAAAFAGGARVVVRAPGPRGAGARAAAGPGAGGAQLLEAPAVAGSVDERAEAAGGRREASELLRFTSGYHADDGEAWRCLGITAALWSLALGTMHVTGGHWASVVFMALCILRCFIVFHDACHLSFFEDAGSNRALAWVSQLFASYSSERWDEVHNPHHAHFGKAEIEDTAATVFFSEEELSASPWYFQLGHRIIRDPFLYFPLGGLWIYWIGNPPKHLAARVWVPLLIWFILGETTLWGYFWAGCIAGAIGVGLFHLQHFCNTPYRSPERERTHLDAALMGSTRMPLPFPLSVFTLGIEYHHIHHLDVRVPGYRLEQCDSDGQARGLWHRANTIDFWRGFKSMFHTQFEGSRKSSDSSGAAPRFVSFWPYSALGLQDL